MVESFVADLVMFMLHQMGKSRAEEFKLKHFGYNTAMAGMSHLRTASDMQSEKPNRLGLSVGALE